ncbi:MAG: hypothetical protein H6739_03240 [Alphaproteobacteria bacterium]|nr:hypothetical protein [Alphaproteobacteria bacterium]
MTTLLILSGVAFGQDERPRPSFDPYLLAQVWATVYDMDVAAQADPAGYGDPEDDPGFKLRRARVGFTGEWERLDYGVVVGVSSGADPIISDLTNQRIGIIDAYGAYTFGDPERISTRVVFGTQRVPYGRENLISSRELAFQERTIASNHLGPFREVGVLADVQAFGARARVGVFNGNDSLFGDTDPGVMLAGRLEYTLGPGDPYRTYGPVERWTLGVGGGALFNPQAATRTLSYGGDLIFRVSGLTVLAEAHMDQLTPTLSEVYEPAVLVQTRRWGAFGQVGYAVGPVEPVARFELFDDDTDTQDNGDVMIGVFGVTTHWLEDHLRLGGGYVLRLETFGASIPNDTVRLWGQVSF